MKQLKSKSKFFTIYQIKSDGQKCYGTITKHKNLLKPIYMYLFQGMKGKKTNQKPTNFFFDISFQNARKNYNICYLMNGTELFRFWE